MSKAANEQTAMIEAADLVLKKSRRKWVCIMIGICVLIVAAAVVAGVINRGWIPVALVAAIIGVTVTVKLCADQIGKAVLRWKQDRDRMDGGEFSRFSL